MSDSARSPGQVKGWCPGALRPMMSGDGLVVRIRPYLARLDLTQMLGLCEAALRHGNGVIDLTSRANLQIRGIAPTAHDALLRDLLALNLLDPDPATESRRNVLTVPFWRPDDLTTRLHRDLVARLSDLPILPAKMGIALDTGLRPVLQDASADIRLERSASGELVLRADGSAEGCAVTQSTAIDMVIAMANWFCDTGGAAQGRMARHLAHTPLPARFTGTPPAPAAVRPDPGPIKGGVIYGAPFGALDARALRQLIQTSKATGLRTTPWRLFGLEQAADSDPCGFITRADDPALRVQACPGAPHCAQAQAATREIATRLAASLPPATQLHVSGCAKGCAHPAKAQITLIGDGGRFNLVRNGAPWDEPQAMRLTADQILNEIKH